MTYPATATAAKELELEATTARIATERARLADLASRRKDLAELLGEGEDGAPLALPPLTAALIGAIGANGAMFFGYVIYLTRFHETAWNGLLFLSFVLGFGSLPFSARAGAGGRARLGLRRFAIAGIVVASVEVLLALTRA
jgi:hypothetical protein